MFALLIAGVAAAGASTAIAPTTGWNVEFAEARCLASRRYGAETLALKASPMGDVVQLMMIGPGPAVSAQQVDVALVPAGGAPANVTGLLWSSRVGAGQQIRSINLPLGLSDRIFAAPAVRLQMGGYDRSLALRDMADLKRVMKACVDDLAKYWDGESGTAARATANLASYFGPEDFPSDAVMNGWSGSTRVALLVNEQGRVADCMVTETSGEAVLDTQTCNILIKRARFTPARDAAGKPARDRVTTRIVWKVTA